LIHIIIIGVLTLINLLLQLTWVGRQFAVIRPLDVNELIVKFTVMSCYL